MFLVGKKTLGSVREEFEIAMQEMVNQGKWNWIVKKELEDWSSDGQKGLLYVFQKPS